MITLKLVLDKRRAKANGSYPLIFRINNKGNIRDIPTGYSSLQIDWDEATSKISDTGVLLEIGLRDHLILASKRYYSLLVEGVL